MFAHSPVGFNPPVFDGAIPANPNAAKPANGFLVNPLIYIIFYNYRKERKANKIRMHQDYIINTIIRRQLKKKQQFIGNGILKSK